MTGRRTLVFSAFCILHCALALAQPSISYTPKTLTNAEAEAKRGLSHSAKVNYLEGFSDRSTPYSKLGAEIRRQQLLFDRQWYNMEFHAEATSTALQVGVAEGVYAKADGTKVSFATATISVTDATNNQHLYIDVATNTLMKNASWPATETDYLPIADVDAAGGVVTAVRDRRNYARMRITPAFSDLGQTSATAFVVDHDNAGAGVTQQLRFNRGSTDAEDSAWEWDETNDRFNARKQHTTATLAPVNAEQFLVAGTAAIDTAGKIATSTIGAAALYTFGANGATPAGVRLTPGGGAGPPSSGTHAAGELAVDSAGVAYVCATGGTPGTWQKIANQIGGSYQVTIGDATGGSPLTVSGQVTDMLGVNAAESIYLQVGTYQDADGAANATNATIAIGATGSLVRTVTTDKVIIIKTNASGAFTLTITDGTVETTYILSAPAPRSRHLDCSDIGTVQRT